MTGCTSGGYDQLETSPETIEQKLLPAVCERRQTDIFKENYSMISCVGRSCVLKMYSMVVRFGLNPTCSSDGIVLLRSL